MLVTRSMGRRFYILCKKQERDDNKTAGRADVTVDDGYDDDDSCERT